MDQLRGYTEVSKFHEPYHRVFTAQLDPVAVKYALRIECYMGVDECRPRARGYSLRHHSEFPEYGICFPVIFLSLTSPEYSVGLPPVHS